MSPPLGPNVLKSIDIVGCKDRGFLTPPKVNERSMLFMIALKQSETVTREGATTSTTQVAVGKEVEENVVDVLAYTPGGSSMTRVPPGMIGCPRLKVSS